MSEYKNIKTLKDFGRDEISGIYSIIFDNQPDKIMVMQKTDKYISFYETTNPYTIIFIGDKSKGLFYFTLNISTGKYSYIHTYKVRKIDAFLIERGYRVYRSNSLTKQDKE